MKHAKGADVAIHESFITPPDMMVKYGFSAQAALNVATAVHTVPAAFGKVMAEVKPRMAIAFHFFNDFDLRYAIYQGIRSTYDGPLRSVNEGTYRQVLPEND